MSGQRRARSRADEPRPVASAGAITCSRCGERFADSHAFHRHAGLSRPGDRQCPHSAMLALVLRERGDRIWRLPGC